MTTIQEFADGDDETRKAMLFESLMSLLTQAIADDDAVFIKSYARLITEIWNDEGDTNA